jgi:hypothetical protein
VQAGVSQDTLLYISSSNSSSEDDEEVAAELQQLLPRSAQAVLAHIMAEGMRVVCGAGGVTTTG